MMKQKQPLDPTDTNHKKEMLQAVYTLYSGWVQPLPLACQKGCTACCTRSVTMTSLEGEMILDFVKRSGREKWLHNLLSRIAPGMGTAAITMNQFARACLNHQEISEEVYGGWDFSPCIFLENNICGIYAARPFGCRSFGSRIRCTEDRAAEITPIHLTVNTVFTQIIEHVSSDGGYWATMTDILHTQTDMAARRTGETNLLPALPVPGFLLEPHEVPVIYELLRKLSGQFAGKGIFGDLIDNFLPI